jgi:hypothetical protein
MQDGIKNLSINDLFTRLHRALTELFNDASSLVEANNSVKSDNIRTLRSSIIARLANNENIKENENLLKVLDLFVTDKSFIQLVKEDSKEWLEFLEAIEKNLKSIEKDVNPKDRREIERINSSIEKAKSMLRK